MSLPDGLAPTLGPYRLVRELGRGGLGQVFEALSYGASGFERRVAIKLLHQEHQADPGLVRMLIAEGRWAGTLRHQNLVSVEHLDVEDGRYYVVMELIEGADLASLVRHGPAPPPVVWHVAKEVARALAYLHTPSASADKPVFLHRDVSPSNILISSRGEVKLTDFGITKALGRADESTSQSLKGKVAFMSPEQARGDPLDPRSDLFSLGSTLAYALTARLPFEGANVVQTLQLLRQAAPPVLDGAPRMLASLIHRLMSASAPQRPTSAEALYREMVQQEDQDRPSELVFHAFDLASWANELLLR